MNASSLKSKIIALVMLPAIALIYFVYQYVDAKYIQYKNSIYLENSAYYVKSSSALNREIQKERGLSVGYIANGDFFKKMLLKQRKETDRRYEEFLERVRELEFANESETLKNLIKEYESIVEIRKRVDQRSVSVMEVLDVYSIMTGELIESASTMKYHFLSEPFFNLVNSYIMILKICEESGKERALISYALAKHKIEPSIERELFKIDAKLEGFYETFQNESSAVALAIFDQFVTNAVKSRYDDIKRDVVYGGKIGIDSDMWWNIATEYIDAMYGANDEVMKELFELKNSLKKSASGSLKWSLLLLAVCLIAFVLIIWYLARVFEAYNEQVKLTEFNRKLYKAFSEYLETLIFSNSKELYAESLLISLNRLGFFRYLWIAKVDFEKKITPVVGENISKSLLDHTLSQNIPSCEKLKKVFIGVAVGGKYELVESADSDELLNDGVSYFGLFPLGKMDENFYVLVTALKDEYDFNVTLVDYLNRFASAYRFAIEKIMIQKREEENKKELTVMATAFDSYEAITITDATGKIIKINKAFERITGYSEDEAIGQNPNMLKSGLHDKSFYTDMWDSIRKNGYWKGEIYNRRKNGEIYPEMLSISSVYNDTGDVTNYVAHFFDISDLKSAQEEAEFRAQHDHLTGLLNRQKLTVELSKVYKESIKSGQISAFIYIDIDNFKQINDLYTHDIGDKVLTEVANRLKSLAYEKDLVGRLGGDEFAFVSVGLGEDKMEAIKRVSILLEKIKSIFEKPIPVDGQAIEVTFSMGVKLFPDAEKSEKEVIICADIAMYHAKKSGKNQYTVFDERLDIQAREFLVLKNEFKKALENSEIVAYYQPKVSLPGRTVCGFEALARWQHPKKGLLPPSAFISATESNRLAFDLTVYMVKMVGKQAKEWKESLEGFEQRIAVNISAEVFNSKRFYDEVERVILESNLDTSLLEFEIVEDVLMQDIDKAIDVIKSFKEMGITFAIDDFGTGYSSFNYLKKLPVDTLKIDRSFLENLESSNNRDIVRILIDAASIFGMNSVAEGVESKEIEEFLYSCGCRCYQGYLFSKPISAKEVEAVWKSWRNGDSVVA